MPLDGAALLGVYYGNQGWKMVQVRDLENWQGKRHAVVNLFTNWCHRTKDLDNLFNQQLSNIWKNQNVPMISWEPYLCSARQTPADVEVRAADGEYDAYVDAWAGRLKTWLAGGDGAYGTGDDRRAYLRLAHEMNGDWYPWSGAMGGNSPADYVAMWRRVRTLFASRGISATHVQWVWAVNHTDVGGFAAEHYYPGDADVDWIALDGYNWGESQTWSDWQAPAAVYDDMRIRLRNFTSKPLALTEFASSTAAPNGVGVTAKSQWITDVFAYVAAHDIRLVAWFNEDKETDWGVFGGSKGDCTYRVGPTTYKCFASYKSAVSAAGVVPSDPTNPRLLTDAQFRGQ